MLPKVYRTDPDMRAYQINTLKIFNDNVLEVCEGLEYKIPFASGQNELNLHISLSKDFPKEKPILRISPIVLHHWLNTEGEVTTAPGLLNFTVHSDLGRVVQAIIRELEKDPPPLVGSSPHPFEPPPSITQSPITSSSDITDISGFFPQLQTMSMDDLEFLNANPDRQLQFINSEIPVIREQNRALDELIQQIEELAVSNLNKHCEVRDLQKSVDEQIAKATQLSFENEKLHDKYKAMSDKYSPANIKRQLGIEAQNAESDCEEIADDFLKGKIGVDKFVSSYIPTRTVCQMRKTKEEKLTQQLKRLEKAGF